MPKTVRPGRPVDPYYAAPVGNNPFAPTPPPRPRPVFGPRPGYKPPVTHEHGSRRQEEYRQITPATAVRESMNANVPEMPEGESSLLWNMPEDHWWAREARADEAWRERKRQEAADRRASDAAIDELRARLSGDDPAKVRTHISANRRVKVSDLAPRLGLTPAQMATLINERFHEYVQDGRSTVASIVATEILDWYGDGSHAEVQFVLANLCGVL